MHGDTYLSILALQCICLTNESKIVIVFFSFAKTNEEGDFTENSRENGNPWTNFANFHQNLRIKKNSVCRGVFVLFVGCISVVAVCCWLSSVSCRVLTVDGRLMLVVGCCWFLVVGFSVVGFSVAGCWLFIVGVGGCR